MSYKLIMAILVFNATYASDINLVKHCIKDNYQDISHIDSNYITFKDNTKIIWTKNKERSYREKLDNPFMQDSFEYPYPKVSTPNNPTHDSSRIRDDEFFKKIYGNTKDEVKQNLIKIEWVDGTTVYFNKKNGAANALLRVAENLKKLPDSYKKYVTDISGTYIWRYVAKSNSISPHSFGIAIDINLKYSRYWLWDQKTGNNTEIHQIPNEIVKIFENEGFIWGGKWWHYDTMHFEYRPEIICFSKAKNDIR